MSGGYLNKISDNINQNNNNNKYFKGNPDITFFKKVYKKISNFNIHILEQDLIGNIDFGNIINCDINKSGDLIKNIYLQITLPDLIKPNNSKWYGYTNNIGCSIIKTITLKINDIIIEKLYGEWIDIYYQINNINNDDLILQFNSLYSIRNTDNFIHEKNRIVYIPIPFYFTKNTGLALPLLALNNSNITIDIEFRNLEDIIKVDNFNFINLIKKKTESNLQCKLFTELIYLDDKEKNIFVNKNLEYLIESVQFNNDEFINKIDTYKNIYPDFRFLVKQFIWTISIDNSNLDNILKSDHNNITMYTTKYSNYLDTFDTLEIKLDNKLVIDENALYFRKVQSNLYFNNKLNKHIYSYSFSINPLNYQPTGYINLSNIDDILFAFKFKDYKLNTSGSATNGIIKIYAIHYNVLKIVSGMASLLYSN